MRFCQNLSLNSNLLPLPLVLITTSAPCRMSPICTHLSECGNGSGRSSTPSTMEKIAVVAPTPSASIITAVAVKPGDFNKMAHCDPEIIQRHRHCLFARMIWTNQKHLLAQTTHWPRPWPHQYLWQHLLSMATSVATRGKRMPVRTSGFRKLCPPVDRILRQAASVGRIGG